MSTTENNTGETFITFGERVEASEGGRGGLGIGFHGLIVATSNEGNGPVECKICPYIGMMLAIPNATGAVHARRPNAATMRRKAASRISFSRSASFKNPSLEILRSNGSHGQNFIRV